MEYWIESLDKRLINQNDSMVFYVLISDGKARRDCARNEILAHNRYLFEAIDLGSGEY